MAIRMHLVFCCVALCLLSLQNANALSLSPFLEKVASRIVSFSWNDCSGASDPLKIKSLAVTPDPIRVPGPLVISTSFTISAASGTDLAAAVVMEKKVAGFYVKVPCVDNIGSCTYGDLCKDWADACPKYFSKYGIPCTCPIPPNTYTIDNAALNITGSLPSIISGEYRFTANLVSAATGHVGCLQIDVTLESK